MEQQLQKGNLPINHTAEGVGDYLTGHLKIDNLQSFLGLTYPDAMEFVQLHKERQMVKQRGTFLGGDAWSLKYNPAH